MGKCYFAKHNTKFVSMAVVGPGQVYGGTSKQIEDNMCH